MKHVFINILIFAAISGCSKENDDESGTLHNPISITIGTPYSGTISANSSQYFNFDSPGGYYRIEIKGLGSDCGVELYDDGSFEALLDSADYSSGTNDEEIFHSCQNKTYFVKVNELGGTGGTLILQVDEWGI